MVCVKNSYFFMCMCVLCVRACTCVRACVRACVRVHVCVRTCVQANKTLTCLEVHNNGHLKGFMEMASEFLHRNSLLLAERQADVAQHLKQVHEKIIESDTLVQGIIAKATATIHKERRCVPLVQGIIVEATATIHKERRCVRAPFASRHKQRCWA